MIRGFLFFFFSNHRGLPRLNVSFLSVSRHLMGWILSLSGDELDILVYQRP